MGRSVAERVKDAGRAVKGRLRYYRAVLEDPRTPRAARWLLGGALAYAASPFDLIPDFIPILGALDDLVILPGMIWWAMCLVPRAVRQDHAHLLVGSARDPEPGQES
jgi:uncharacterized membrane protein YkvA (DUF1232 family)